MANPRQGRLGRQPSEALRQLVTPEVMRESGAYFTGARLSNLAVRKIGASIDNRSIILDPACGAGDLLVACCNRLARNDLVQKKKKNDGQFSHR